MGRKTFRYVCSMFLVMCCIVSTALISVEAGNTHVRPDIPQPSAQAKTYSVTYSVSGVGTLNCGKKSSKKLQYSVQQGSPKTFTVKAVAGQGYHFTKWSDGITAQTRTDNISNKKLAVTAIFEKDSDPVVDSSPVPTPVTSQAETENWSMKVNSQGGGKVEIIIDSNETVSVSAVLVYKANPSLTYDVGTIGNWSSGTYLWTAKRPGPPGEYTICFNSARGQLMTSADVTL